jgi:hypothetical protein
MCLDANLESVGTWLLKLDQAQSPLLPMPAILGLSACQQFCGPPPQPACGQQLKSPAGAFLAFLKPSEIQNSTLVEPKTNSPLVELSTAKFAAAAGLDKAHRQ